MLLLDYFYVFFLKIIFDEIALFLRKKLFIKLNQINSKLFYFFLIFANNVKIL